jgi:hypothetical protein
LANFAFGVPLYLGNTALQPALKPERFLRMQAVIAGMFGISLEQKRKASPVHAARCSELKSWALLLPTMASRQTAMASAKPTAPRISEKFLIMAVLLPTGRFCGRI